MKEPGDEPLRALLDETAIGIKWITPDGRVAEVNRGLCRLLGYSREELLGRRYDEITHPDDLEQDAALFAQLLDGRIRSYAIDKRYFSKTGELLYVRVTSALARTPEVLRLAIVEDMRARRDAESIRREGEVRFQSILQAVPDGMVIIDEAGLIQSFSPSAERLFGYVASEVIGKNVSILMPSPHRELHDSYIERYLATGERRIIGIGRVVSGARKDGSVFPMELSVGEARIEGRRIFTGFIRNLTERQEAERRLDHLQRELMHVARLSEMGQMGSTLAHELNQPLTAITNYLNAGRRLLESQGVAGTERIIETMDKAGAQAQRAGEIIRHLRRFVEKREADRREEDVNKVVEEASALALVGVKGSGIVVRTRFGRDLPAVLIDKVQIQQVIVNLVRNAVDAMARSPEKVLTIATSDAGGVVSVRVADTGPGLDPTIADKLFKPFVTTKEEGMGIGLSIGRQIVEAHGGRIMAETSERGGAVFAFTLPAAPPAAG